jgi:hypothetical protein
MVTEADLNEGRVYPPLYNIREVSTQLAARIVEYTYSEGIATTYPEPSDKVEFIRKNQFSTDYESFIPVTYSWPGIAE